MKNREYLFNLDDYDLAEYLVTFVRQDIDGNDVRQCFYRAFDLNLLSERGEN